MKKFITLLLTLVMLLSLLVGCRGFTLPEGLSGSDAAKLLLANERLNAQLLKTEGDIFENGVEVMNNLAATALSNLNATYTSGKTYTAATLSKVRNASTVLEGDYSGRVEISGDNFVWSGFEENNNSYDAFKSTTDGIVSSANLCAELIDNIKKNVRVVDKWVDTGNAQYYLSVAENSETLYERNLTDNQLTVCKRYKNADGDDVYELYIANDSYKERSTYIPGKRYERSSINDYSDHTEDYFVADNSRGYWETYVVGVAPAHYNVSYFIMKGDICYDAFYDSKNGSLPLLKVMSADKATDIINFSNNSVSVKFSGFNGIRSVEAPADSVSYVTGEYANLSSGEKATVNLTNGRSLHFGDSFVNDKVQISGIHVGFGGEFGYTGEITLNIQGETNIEVLENLKGFLSEVGLTCRRDINGVYAGIHRAYVELDSIIKYYTWNGVSVTTEAGIAQAITKEKARFDSMAALYTAVKDSAVIDINDTEAIEMNIKFAPITEKSFSGVRLDGGRISVGGGSLTIEDTTLYVEGEPYKVKFALANQNSGLVHLDIANLSSIKYANEEKLTVTTPSLEFELPALSEGKYTLVAYIATSDSVRASAYTPVAVESILNMPITIQNTTVSAEKGEGNALVITYKGTNDSVVTLSTEKAIDYKEFKALVSGEAFELGTPSDIIEVYSGNGYTALKGNESKIANGKYRIAYKNHNGSKLHEGYLYVNYTCE